MWYTQQLVMTLLKLNNVDYDYETLMEVNDDYLEYLIELNRR